MGLNAAMIEVLVAKGLSAQDILEVAKAAEKKADPTNAERQARHRANKRKRNTVTVTRDPPIDNNHTPISSDDEITPNAAKQPVGKPEEVSDQVWRDFTSHRKAQRAPITATALSGIRREADQVGWTLEAALAECVSRGWRGFKAEWVKPPPASNDQGGGMAAAILAKRR